MEKLLNELRAELLAQGFDASQMSNAQLVQWLAEAGIEIIPA